MDKSPALFELELLSNISYDVSKLYKIEDKVLCNSLACR